jgi:hypothetical protein
VSDQPLHVQVAEALGWKLIPYNELPGRFCREGATHVWATPSGEEFCARCNSEMPPRYDLDWSATGPLIEKYGICQYLNCGVWHSFTASDGDDCGDGAAPLESLCRLILALGKAGKLTATPEGK